MVHWTDFKTIGALGLAAMLTACGGDDGGTGDDFGEGEGPSTSGPTSTSSPSSSESGTGDTTGTDDGPVLDVGFDTEGDTEEPSICKVNDDMDALPPCEETSPPDSFEPDVQWVFDGDGGYISSYVTPLIANFTDDNDDGEVDLCDTPDVLVTMYGGGDGRMYLLDGATGTVHYFFPGKVSRWTTPAIGDIDGDGLVEVVTAVDEGPSMDSPVVAFEHDGTQKWVSTELWDGQRAMNGSVALADLDNDGDVEIICGNLILNHDGTTSQEFNDYPNATLGWRPSAATAADLDGDDDLEVVLGHTAYHHDGTNYYNQTAAFEYSGLPHVADLDDDGLPEVLFNTKNGISLLEHDGSITFQDLRPTGDGTTHLNWSRPAAIHDFDGDGFADFAMSSGSNYSVYLGDASVMWSMPVQDNSGISSGTAFDFLGDGVAEAMYTDEVELSIFDGATGQILLEQPRFSPTIVEYPTVADVDNDGSAEILVVSTSGAPPLQVIRDVEDRWIPARRIWNQHTYHVTNVREDGTIPQLEPKHWLLLNTFRTQAQFEGGGVCKPEG